MSLLEPLEGEKRDVKRENGIRRRFFKKFSVDDERPPEFDSEREESPPLFPFAPEGRSESRGSEKESEPRRADGNLLFPRKKFSIKVLSN